MHTQASWRSPCHTLLSNQWGLGLRLSSNQETILARVDLMVLLMRSTGRIWRRLVRLNNTPADTFGWPPHLTGDQEVKKAVGKRTCSQPGLTKGKVMPIRFRTIPRNDANEILCAPQMPATEGARVVLARVANQFHTFLRLMVGRRSGYCSPHH